MLIAVLNLAYFARHRLWPRAQAPAGKIMLAVLPFENLSDDPEKDYFSDGLTEEMIAQLGGMQPQQLGVIARTSAMRYKHTDKGISQIGRELGVNFILEGSVRHMGDRVRITAQLIQVKDQTHLWAESYERDLAGVFAAQTEVAGRIRRSLALELLPGQQPELARAPTANSAAYEAYLKGRYHWHKGSAEERRKARDYFEQAVQIDPKYAPGYAGLADYYWATPDLPPQVAMPKAKEYALKAVELDDTLAHAHTALAVIRWFGDWDWLGAEAEINRALALNPNHAEAHRIYSFYLLALGRFEQALAEVRRAEELDPLSLLISVNAGWTSYFARQYDRAIEQCRKALELDANSDGAHACLGQSYRAKGMHEPAIAESRLAVTLSGGHPARVVGLARAYAAAGRKSEAGKVLEELRQRGKRSYVPAYLLAMTHAALGEEEKALAALERAYAERDRYLIWLKVDEVFDPLRGEPRFQDLLRRVGFPP
jgi:TolB-like protein/Flp pilus assembly protein TadD